jgi:prepilin-type N-terminal cleavage/methylation domain-containing protein
MKLQNIKKGFTLIELLVVITIIGILATWATTVYTSQIQKARDTTRVTDIKALQGWVEQYYQDSSVYPIWLSNWTTDSTSVMTFLPNLAEDPKHDQTCNGSRCWYIYFVGSDENLIAQGSYEISTAFESQWNVDNKAATDTWGDDDRLEVWLNNNTNDTSADQGTPFSNNTAGNTTATLVIVKSSVQIQ